MTIKITARSLGLLMGGAAIAASAVWTMSHDGGQQDAVNLAKAGITTGNPEYTTPSVDIRSGGSDSGATTTANAGH